MVEHTLQRAENAMAFNRILHVKLVPNIFAILVHIHQSVSCANVTIQSFDRLLFLLPLFSRLILLQFLIHVAVTVIGATFYTGVYVVVWIVNVNHPPANIVVRRHGTVVVQLATGLGVDVRAPNLQPDSFF